MSSSAATPDDPHLHRRQSIFARWPVLTGVAVGVATLVPHAFLPPDGSVGFAAIVIALIAGIYFGFAHHRRLRLPLVAIPSWYPPWCVIIDVIVGVGLLVIWCGHGFI